jgi:pimeloyl-ACP methyl ester carboxylesterase
VTAFVFLHGGGQGGWVWDETIAAMREQSGAANRYLALDAPGCGAKRGRDTSGMAFADISRELIGDIEAAGLRDVVLVGHSQAGMTMPQMAQFAPGLFSKLIFVTCTMPLPGKTTLDQMGLGLHGSNPDQVGWPVDPMTSSMEDRFRLMFCNDMDQAAAATFLARLGADQWPACCYDYSDWQTDHLAAIPVSYVVCLDDLALPHEWQERYAGRLHADHVVRIAGGHQVMNTRPQALAEVLLAECGC